MTIPAWLTWKLFWKVLPYVSAALALGAAVWYIDHRGYKRAEAEATARETERVLALERLKLIMAIKVDQIEKSMQEAINESDSRVVGTLSQLEVTNRTIIQPTLLKEIQSEERFSDPDTGISDGMRDELNRARSLSQQRPCPAGSTAVACFAVSGPEPIE